MKQLPLPEADLIAEIERLEAEYRSNVRHATPAEPEFLRARLERA